MAGEPVVERVPAEATFALRQAVLGRTPTPGEGDRSHGVAGDGHFAVLADGEAVATAVVVRRDAPLGLTHDDAAWHLLGIAVDPAYRARGLGTAVLTTALKHVAANGGGTVWCHARVDAVPMFERHGFVAGAHRIEDPVGGTQVFMTLHVQRAA
jgi:ribosomal protein S18 acetylase RimI-like enzyme